MHGNLLLSEVGAFYFCRTVIFGAVSSKFSCQNRGRKKKLVPLQLLQLTTKCEITMLPCECTEVMHYIVLIVAALIGKKFTITI